MKKAHQKTKVELLLESKVDPLVKAAQYAIRENGGECSVGMRKALHDAFVQTLEVDPF